MRRKIMSLILKHGLPSIWYTINPDDIVNPVKLNLAAFNKHEGQAAKDFLAELNRAYKKLALAIGDPVSAAEFFHRETLDEAAYHTLKQQRSADFDPATILMDKEKILQNFSSEANFVAATKQIHTHTPTCVKYSMKHRNPTRPIIRSRVER
ncbi:hypothetical protein CPLU01_15994 [Colletotrichum plurivorum]|uniref:Helitron helicase-like domain-containing protein n=1 Tax=Colletotrichum plurivorum TaxID=2175906 RepID=A0A8H6J2M7_9PEZI|nr:hypothetical protein CPLU01_15994 [Colletotrichum plurivorum]